MPLGLWRTTSLKLPEIKPHDIGAFHLRPAPARVHQHLRVLAVTTEPRVIAAILAHLENRAARAPPPLRH
jgi:hypothetical protein